MIALFVGGGFLSREYMTFLISKIRASSSVTRLKRGHSSSLNPKGNVLKTAFWLCTPEH